MIWLILMPVSWGFGFYIGATMMATFVEQNLRNEGWSKEAIRQKILKIPANFG